VIAYPPLYFAYGSNLNPDQVEDRCPGARLVGTALLLDYQFGYFRWSGGRWKPGGVADIRKSPNKEVWGAIYNFSEDSWKAMDYLEGVQRGGYQRISGSVIFENKTLVVNTYQSNNQIPNNQEAKPIPAYWEMVSSGASRVGLPESYQKWLKNHYRSLDGAHLL
jgi:gamma-glutamylcyclotransferase (GGCT)/AIG2-like uncharacterized protein YtfP